MIPEQSAGPLSPPPTDGARAEGHHSAVYGAHDAGSSAALTAAQLWGSLHGRPRDI